MRPPLEALPFDQLASQIANLSKEVIQKQPQIPELASPSSPYERWLNSVLLSIEADAQDWNEYFLRHPVPNDFF
jgi:hypothetical protein